MSLNTETEDTYTRLKVKKIYNKHSVSWVSPRNIKMEESSWQVNKKKTQKWLFRCSVYFFRHHWPVAKMAIKKESFTCHFLDVSYIYSGVQCSTFLFCMKTIAQSRTRMRKQINYQFRPWTFKWRLEEVFKRKCRWKYQKKSNTSVHVKPSHIAVWINNHHISQAPTFLKYSRALTLALHRSVQSWTPAIRTPWCFSLSKDAAGPIKFSAKSGTFLIILMEHKAAFHVSKNKVSYKALKLWNINLRTLGKKLRGIAGIQSPSYIITCL